MNLEAYSKLSSTSRIGLSTCVEEIQVDNGTNLPITLKPPKISPKSKKLYKDVFIRTLKKGRIHHLYSLERLYIASLYMPIEDAKKWIDKNESKIKERVNGLSQQKDRPFNST